MAPVRPPPEPSSKWSSNPAPKSRNPILGSSFDLLLDPAVFESDDQIRGRCRHQQTEAEGKGRVVRVEICPNLVLGDCSAAPEFHASRVTNFCLW